MDNINKRNIDSDQCESTIVHKMVEYNINLNDIDDEYIVAINMKNTPIFFGYKKKDQWYRENDELIENKEDIVSFFDFPIPSFFGRRKKQ